MFFYQGSQALQACIRALRRLARIGCAVPAAACLLAASAAVAQRATPLTLAEAERRALEGRDQASGPAFGEPLGLSVSEPWWYWCKERGRNGRFLHWIGC